MKLNIPFVSSKHKSFPFVHNPLVYDAASVISIMKQKGISTQSWIIYRFRVQDKSGKQIFVRRQTYFNNPVDPRTN